MNESKIRMSDVIFRQIRRVLNCYNDMVFLKSRMICHCSNVGVNGHAISHYFLRMLEGYKLYIHQSPYGGSVNE